MNAWKIAEWINKCDSNEVMVWSESPKTFRKNYRIIYYYSVIFITILVIFITIITIFFQHNENSKLPFQK